MTPTQLSALLAWPLTVAATVTFGTSVFLIFFAPDGASSAFADSIDRCWRWLAALNLVVSPFAMLVGIASMADTSIFGAIAVAAEVIRETVFGHLWAARMPLAVLLLIVTLRRRHSTPSAIAISALSAAMLLIQSLGSHAIDKGGFAVAVYFAHQMAAGLWIGALVTLVIAESSDSDSEPWLGRVTPRVSTVASWSVAVLLVSGTYTAWNAIGWRPDLLVYSLYGRTLMWKLATAATVVLVGGYNRYRLVPTVNESSARAALVRNVAAECLLLCGVLAWSAILANTPPPH